MLDDFVLAKDLMELCGLSANAFRYWKNAYLASYENSQIVFIKRSSIPSRHYQKASACTDLSGYVQSVAFCRYTGLSSSLLTKNNKGKIKDFLDILSIGRCKLVSLRRFYEHFGLRLDLYVYIDKCKNFSPLEKKIQITKTLCLGYY